jgi:formiminotetrahydrofolate cyclodeaminase
MLADLTVKDFLDKVAGNDPVPGGGSIAALGGALASALATMVTRLTIGKKGYEASEEVMQHAQTITTRFQKEFIALIKTPKPMMKFLPVLNFPKLPMKKKLPAALPFRKPPGMPLSFRWKLPEKHSK